MDEFSRQFMPSPLSWPAVLRKVAESFLLAFIAALVAGMLAAASLALAPQFVLGCLWIPRAWTLGIAIVSFVATLAFCLRKTLWKLREAKLGYFRVSLDRVEYWADNAQHRLDFADILGACVLNNDSLCRTAVYAIQSTPPYYRKIELDLDGYVNMADATARPPASSELANWDVVRAIWQAADRRQELDLPLASLPAQAKAEMKHPHLKWSLSQCSVRARDWLFGGSPDLQYAMADANGVLLVGSDKRSFIPAAHLGYAAFYQRILVYVLLPLPVENRGTLSFFLFPAGAEKHGGKVPDMRQAEAVSLELASGSDHRDFLEMVNCLASCFDNVACRFLLSHPTQENHFKLDF